MMDTIISFLTENRKTSNNLLQKNSIYISRDIVDFFLIHPQTSHFTVKTPFFGTISIFSRLNVEKKTPFLIIDFSFHHSEKPLSLNRKYFEVSHFF